MEEDWFKTLCDHYEGELNDECCLEFDYKKNVCDHVMPKPENPFLVKYIQICQEYKNVFLVLCILSIPTLLILYYFTEHWQLINGILVSLVVFLTLYANAKNLKIVSVFILSVVTYRLVLRIYGYFYYDEFTYLLPRDFFVDFYSHIIFGIILYVFCRMAFPRKDYIFVFTMSFLIGVFYEVLEWYFFVSFPNIIDLHWCLDNAFMDITANVIGGLLIALLDRFLWKKRIAFLT